MDSFVRASTTPTLVVPPPLTNRASSRLEFDGIPITGTGGNLASNTFAEDRGTFEAGHAAARIPEGSISNFAPSIVNATSLSLLTMCASYCVTTHTIAGAEHALQVAHHRPRIDGTDRIRHRDSWCTNQQDH